MEAAERDAARSAVQTVTAERDKAQTEVQKLRQQTEEFGEARFDMERTISLLWQGMQDIASRRNAWYRERRDFGTRARFAVRFHRYTHKRIVGETHSFYVTWNFFPKRWCSPRPFYTSESFPLSSIVLATWHNHIQKADMYVVSR